MEEQVKQFVKYDFYKLDPVWRRLDSNEKEQHKEEFAAVLDEFSSGISILPYGLTGIRGDCDFLLWKVSPNLEAFQELGASSGRRAWASTSSCHTPTWR